MRLCTIQTASFGPTFGVEIGKKILRIPAAASVGKTTAKQRENLKDLLSYLHALPASEKALRAILQRIADDPKTFTGAAEDGLPFLIPASEATYLPPVQRPGKILCIGWNYRDHCEEQNRPIPEFPVVFNKYATSLLGDRAEIPLPLKLDQKMDYEAELAVVIGKTAARVSKRAAMKHVAGYMAMNDVSARSLQKKEPQWSRAKGFDGSGPCGPCLVTADEIEDPHALNITCRVNGKVRQKSNTKHLIFGVADLIAYLSEAITLEPGDIISTGTPGGVGVYSNPPVFLKPGDEIQVEIEKIGRLTNKCGER